MLAKIGRGSRLIKTFGTSSDEREIMSDNNLTYANVDLKAMYMITGVVAKHVGQFKKH